jgi:carnitine 3-dehydrogenase
MSEATAASIRRVAVVGAGTIGTSWAIGFLARGLEVTLTDPAPGAQENIRRTIARVWPTMQQLGLAANADPDRWRFAPTVAAALDGAEFVQENAPERYEAKQAVLGEIDALLPAQVVISSSTSGLLLSRLVDRLAHRERVVIGHPFNPPHLIPLVEVVGTTAGRAAVETAMAFYRAVGKRPIEIRKEVPGHVSNRLQGALWREALYLVQEGVASVSDVDAAISEGPGLRWALMGPHLTFHLAGGAGGMAGFIDHLLPAVKTWWDDLGEPEMTEAFRRTFLAGIVEETGGRSISALEQERDEKLTRILAARRLS